MFVAETENKPLLVLFHVLGFVPKSWRRALIPEFGVRTEVDLAKLTRFGTPSLGASTRDLCCS